MRKIRHPVKVSEIKKQKKAQLREKHMKEKTAPLKDWKLSASLDENLSRIEKIFGESGDLLIRRFHVAADVRRQAAVVYIDGLIDSSIIDNFVLRTLMVNARSEPQMPHGREDLLHFIKEAGLTINEIEEVFDFERLAIGILSGDTVLLVDHMPLGILMNTKGWQRRGVEEPNTESVIRGPRDGFTETLRSNSALIRVHLKDPNLRAKHLKVGERSHTDVILMYIEGIIDPDLLKTVEQRVKAIEVDAALESGYIEQFIEDRHWSPFPQVQNTERPDKAVANLLEGKVVILVDGTPFALIAPAVFTQFYQSPEDYYERFLIGTMVRLIRLISVLMALLLPSLYIAFSSFHPEMIPSELVIAMAAGRATVPFPSVVEAIIMEGTIEVLREASVRLPGPIGPTIGIVGALVIGQSAVEAGIVSPILVIIVGLTTIGSFASPSYSAAIAIRMLRFPMMIAAGIFGLYGMMLMLIAITIHLCGLKSFGVPYMAPMTPSRRGDMKDVFIRFPLYRMEKRPQIMKPRDEKRMADARQSNREIHQNDPDTR